MTKKDEEKLTTGVKGTFEYMAPELISKAARDFKAIDHKAADVWALGISLY